MFIPKSQQFRVINYKTYWKKYTKYKKIELIYLCYCCQSITFWHSLHMTWWCCDYVNVNLPVHAAVHGVAIGKKKTSKLALIFLQTSCHTGIPRPLFWCAEHIWEQDYFHTKFVYCDAQCIILLSRSGILYSIVSFYLWHCDTVTM